MKDHDLEARIVAARPETKETFSRFTLESMQLIKNNATFFDVARTTGSKVNRRTKFMKQLTINRRVMTLATVLVLCSAIVVGYALEQNKKAQQTLDKAGQAQNTSPGTTKPAQIVAPPVEQKTQQPAAADYIDIKEWKVRLAFEDADKVTYRMLDDAVTAGSGVQFIHLYLKDEVTSVERCRPLGVSISRDTKNTGGDSITKIGEYYYGLGGGAGACDGDPGGPNGSINQLRKKIIGDQLGSSKYTLMAM